MLWLRANCETCRSYRLGVFSPFAELAASGILHRATRAGWRAASILISSSLPALDLTVAGLMTPWANSPGHYRLSLTPRLDRYPVYSNCQTAATKSPHKVHEKRCENVLQRFEGS